MKQLLYAVVSCTLWIGPTQVLFAWGGQSRPVDTSVQASDLNSGDTVPQSWMAEETHRWLDLDALSLSFRYRSQVASDGFRYIDNGQEKSLIAGRVKLDAAGKYAVHFRVSSGRVFNWSYSDVIGKDFDERVPAATAFIPPAVLNRLFAAVAADPAQFVLDAHYPSRGWEMYFRELYFSAAPIKQISLEYGSLAIDHGQGTEATTYDDDGYITGERLRILDPKHLYLDQIAVTYAYEGDRMTPNFFARGERLLQSNYHQILAEKKFGSKFNASVDYTFDKGSHITREAVFVKTPELRFIDSVRPELYQRVNDVNLNGEVFRAGKGLAITASKTFVKKFQLDAGFASIDHGYSVLTGDRIGNTVGFSLNGDAFLTGTRVFVKANWKINPYMNLFGYFTHEVTAVPATEFDLNKQSLNLGATVDFKSILTRFHAL